MKLSIQLGVSIVLLLVLASCSRKDSISETIRIGINAWPGYEFLYLAQEKGFFEEEGVAVRIVEFNSLADGRRAYERGQLDGLACTLIEHIQILDSSDRRPKICIVADYSNGADVILGNSQIKGLEDLKGARIGLEIDSLGVFMLARALNKAGLSVSDVRLQPLDQISIQENFCNGLIDAAISYPPASFIVERDCDAGVIFSSAEIPNEIVDVIVLEEELLEKYPSVVRSIANAYFKAQEWTKSNKQEAYALMGGREGISPEEFEIALSDGIQILGESDQERFFQVGGILETSLAHCERILLETKQLSGNVSAEGSIFRGGIEAISKASE